MLCLSCSSDQTILYISTVVFIRKSVLSLLVTLLDYCCHDVEPIVFLSFAWPADWQLILGHWRLMSALLERVVPAASLTSACWIMWRHQCVCQWAAVRWSPLTTVHRAQRGLMTWLAHCLLFTLPSQRAAVSWCGMTSRREHASVTHRAHRDVTLSWNARLTNVFTSSWLNPLNPDHSTCIHVSSNRCQLESDLGRSVK